MSADALLFVLNEKWLPMHRDEQLSCRISRDGIFEK